MTRHCWGPIISCTLCPPGHSPFNLPVERHMLPVLIVLFKCHSCSCSSHTSLRAGAGQLLPTRTLSCYGRCCSRCGIDNSAVMQLLPTRTCCIGPCLTFSWPYVCSYSTRHRTQSCTYGRSHIDTAGDGTNSVVCVHLAQPLTPLFPVYATQQVLEVEPAPQHDPRRDGTHTETAIAALLQRELPPGEHHCHIPSLHGIVDVG